MRRGSWAGRCATRSWATRIWTGISRRRRRRPEVEAVFGRRRTIPVGIKFGTVGVLDRAGTLHEVTTFRRDVRTDGRHAEVAFGVSLDDDLARRDLTINAIAYSASRDEVRDPFDGQRDLQRRLIRAVGDPETRMREDRLRALRALRFAARFEFEIDPATLAAVAHSAPHLGQLSAERVKQELDKTMEQVRCPSRALRLWRDDGSAGHADSRAGPAAGGWASGARLSGASIPFVAAATTSSADHRSACPTRAIRSQRPAHAAPLSQARGAVGEHDRGAVARGAQESHSNA